MRTFEGTLRALLVGGLLAAAPAHALDGSKTDPSVGPPPMSPMEAFRSGANWLKAGETVKAVNSLEYAAEKGHALAQWKLGRMAMRSSFSCCAGSSVFLKGCCTLTSGRSIG